MTYLKRPISFQVHLSLEYLMLKEAKIRSHVFRVDRLKTLFPFDQLIVRQSQPELFIVINTFSLLADSKMLSCRVVCRLSQRFAHSKAPR